MRISPLSIATGNKSVLFALLLVFLLPITAQAQFAGGSGTESNPYIINTPQQLAYLSSQVNAGANTTKYYKLGADIDMNVAPYNTGDGFIPIGTKAKPFAGTFNGDGHVIKNLYINTSTLQDVGLFGYVLAGTINNLGVVNATVTGSGNVGIIVGTLMANIPVKLLGLSLSAPVPAVISASYSTGTVTGGGDILGLDLDLNNLLGNLLGLSVNVGGIAGYAEASTVSNVYSEADVSGGGSLLSLLNDLSLPVGLNVSANVGGIVGSLAGSTVSVSYATGAIDGGTELLEGLLGLNLGLLSVNAGGIVGLAANAPSLLGLGLGGGSTVEKSIALNSTITTTTILGIQLGTGRVVGGATGTLNNNYGFEHLIINGAEVTGGTLTNKQGANITALDINNGTIINNLFPNPPWTKLPGKLPGLGGSTVDLPGYLQVLSGNGTEDNPYLISSAEELATMANLINSAVMPYAGAGVHYKLGADIDLGVAPYNTGAGWIPIGTSPDGNASTTNTFKGIFDGDSKTVSGLFINNTNLGYAGLFGFADSAEIKNLGVEDVNITGSTHVGGIAGDIANGTISNSHVTGAIKGNNIVGGVAGDVNDAQISDTYFEGTVEGVQFVGGVVAYTESSVLTNLYSTGTVKGTSNFVGGVVGNAESANISGSYSTSAVSGVSVVGGIAGTLNGGRHGGPIVKSLLTTSYFTGTVNGSSSVGGIAGEVTNSDITNSASLASAITSADLQKVGRIAYATEDTLGVLSNNIASVNMSYAPTYTSDAASKDGGDFPFIAGSTAFTDGQGISLSVNAPSYLTATYQWSKDGAPIAGATTSTFSKTGATEADSGSYTVAVTTAGKTFTSEPLKLILRTYTITISPVDTVKFDSLDFGYTAPAAQTVTITNSGNQEIAALAITLGGTNPTAFTLSSETIASIVAGGNGSFTVVPNASLAVGTYNAEITISNTTGISEIINASFKVNKIDILNGGTPQDKATEIAEVVLTGITAPVRDATPVTTAPVIAADQHFTSSAVSWTPTVASTFLAGTEYTATVTLTPATNYSFDGLTSIEVGVVGSENVDANFIKNDNGTVTITLQFPMTSPFPSKDPENIDPPNEPGSENNPYIIGSAEDLANLAKLINDGVSPYADDGVYYELANDIDLDVAPYNTGAGWTPIGDSDSPFTGIFDGNGKTISGLTIDNPDLNDAGLFGVVGDGTDGTGDGVVENLTVEDVNISAGENVGGIIGHLKEGSSITNSNANGTVEGTGDNIGGIVGLDDNIGDACEGTTCGVVDSEFASFGGAGTEDNPYLITTAEEFAELDSLINDNISPFADDSIHYQLANDINLGVAPYNSGTGWTPIGDSDSPFTGIFDGNGKTISGLTIDNPDLNDAGLFGVVGDGTNGGTITNTVVKDANITADKAGSNAGIIAGSINGGTIENSIATGTVSGDNAGAIAGSATNADIANNAALGATIDGTTNAGRIIGENANSTLANNLADLNSLVNGEKTTDGTATNLNGADFPVISGSNLFTIGRDLTLNVTIPNFPQTTQWSKDGAAIAGATNTTFRKTAATGDEGAYTVAVTILGDTYTSAPITLAERTAGILLSVTDVNFAPLSAGYTPAQRPMQAIVIENVGTETVSGLAANISGTNPTAFVLLDKNEASLTTIASIAAGATDTFYVAPAANLAINPYSAIVSVTDNAAISESFNVTFEVTTVKITMPTLSGTDAIITAPVTGATPQTAITTDGTENYTTGKVTWMPNDPVFKGGTAYTATVTLTAKDGYSFENGASSVTLNRTFAATEAATITSIAILNQPDKMTYTEGEELILTGLMTELTYNDQTTSISNFFDLDGHGITTDPLNRTVLLYADNNKTVKIMLKSNNEISDETAALTVNQAAKTPIPSIAITGITAPVAGATPQTEVTLNGGENYTAGTITWTPADATFKADKAYTASIKLAAADDYSFVGLTTVTINGKPATITNNTYDSVTVSYTFAVEIPTVAITGITAPVTGEAPVTAAPTPPADANYTISAITWSPTSAKILGDSTYTATVVLTAKSGYFFTETTAIDEEPASRVLSSTGEQLTVSYTFTTDAPTIERILISKQPSKFIYKAGDALDLSGLEVSVLYNDGTEGNVAFADFADYGIETDIADGTELTEDNNGQTITVYFEDDNTIFSNTTALIVTKEAITTVAISDITAPVKGATPQTTVALTGDENYTAGAITWSPADETFRANTAYTATIILTAAEDYSFAGTTATINGQPAIISANIGKTVKLSYTFPATEPDSAYNFAHKPVFGDGSDDSMLRRDTEKSHGNTEYLVVETCENEVFGTKPLSIVIDDPAAEFTFHDGSVEQTGNQYKLDYAIEAGRVDTVSYTISKDGKTKTDTLVIETHFPYDSVIVQKFNNVLLVNNNPETNGGYTFTDYKWFKNGTQLPGSGQYYSAGPLKSNVLDESSDYNAEMQTAKGERLSTCASKPVLVENTQSATYKMQVLGINKNAPVNAEIYNSKGQNSKGEASGVYIVKDKK